MGLFGKKKKDQVEEKKEAKQAGIEITPAEGVTRGLGGGTVEPLGNNREELQDLLNEFRGIKKTKEQDTVDAGVEEVRDEYSGGEEYSVSAEESGNIENYLTGQDEGSNEEVEEYEDDVEGEDETHEYEDSNELEELDEDVDSSLDEGSDDEELEEIEEDEEPVEEGLEEYEDESDVEEEDVEEEASDEDEEIDAEEEVYEEVVDEEPLEEELEEYEDESSAEDEVIEEEPEEEIEEDASSEEELQEEIPEDEEEIYEEIEPDEEVDSEEDVYEEVAENEEDVDEEVDADEVIDDEDADEVYEEVDDSELEEYTEEDDELISSDDSIKVGAGVEEAPVVPAQVGVTSEEIDQKFAQFEEQLLNKIMQQFAKFQPQAVAAPVNETKPAVEEKEPDEDALEVKTVNGKLVINDMEFTGEVVMFTPIESVKLATWEEVVRRKGHCTYHLTTSSNGGWFIKKSNAPNPFAYIEKKEEAIELAKLYAKREKAELKIHNAKGVIEKSLSFGREKLKG